MEKVFSTLLVLLSILSATGQDFPGFRPDYNLELFGVGLTIADTSPHDILKYPLQYNKTVRENYSRYSKLETSKEFGQWFGLMENDIYLYTSQMFYIDNTTVRTTDSGEKLLESISEEAATMRYVFGLARRLSNVIGFEEFFVANLPYYKDYCTAMDLQVLTKIDYRWFEKFIGPKPGIVFDYIFDMSRKEKSGSVLIPQSPGYYTGHIVLCLNEGDDPFADDFDAGPYIALTVVNMIGVYCKYLSDIYSAELTELTEKYGKEYGAAGIFHSLVYTALSKRYFAQNPNPYFEYFNYLVEGQPEISRYVEILDKCFDDYLEQPIGYSSFELYYPKLIAAFEDALRPG